ncbi:MAG: hypothetical protein ABEK00_02335 [Candidatus Nanohaloarchaea archaeon]
MAGSQISFSPLTKSILLLLAFAGFYLTAQNIEGKEIRIITSGLSGFSAVFFILYTFFRFDLGPSVVLLGLAVSAVVFMVVGYNLERLKSFDWPVNSRQAVIGAVVLGLAFVAVDVATSDLSYSYQWKDSVNLSADQDVQLGQVTVENSFFLPREVERPEYRVCLYTPGKKEVYSRIESSDGLLWRGERKMNVTVRSVDRAEHEPVNGSFSVESIQGEECPDSVTGEKLVVVKEAR